MNAPVQPGQTVDMRQVPTGAWFLFERGPSVPNQKAKAYHGLCRLVQLHPELFPETDEDRLYFMNQHGEVWPAKLGDTVTAVVAYPNVYGGTA